MKSIILWVICFVISLFGLRFGALTLTATQFSDFWGTPEFAVSLLGFSVIIATLISGINFVIDKINKQERNGK